MSVPDLCLQSISIHNIDIIYILTFFPLLRRVGNLKAGGKMLTHRFIYQLDELRSLFPQVLQQRCIPFIYKTLTGKLPEHLTSGTEILRTSQTEQLVQGLEIGRVDSFLFTDPRLLMLVACLPVARISSCRLFLNVRHYNNERNTPVVSPEARLKHSSSQEASNFKNS